MKSLRKNIFLLPILIVVIIYVGYIVLNVFFGGWYGYEKWKPRRSTFGNKNEALERNVFVKDLKYKSSIPVDSFSVFIEKGFRYGFTSSNTTRLVEDGWPYQVSFIETKGTNDINYYLINGKKYGAIDNLNIYLKEAYLKDTLYIGINKYDLNKWDSIGYIKVWDRR